MTRSRTTPPPHEQHEVEPHAVDARLEPVGAVAAQHVADDRALPRRAVRRRRADRVRERDEPVGAGEDRPLELARGAAGCARARARDAGAIARAATVRSACSTTDVGVVVGVPALARATCVDDARRAAPRARPRAARARRRASLSCRSCSAPSSASRTATTTRTPTRDEHREHGRERDEEVLAKAELLELSKHVHRPAGARAASRSAPNSGTFRRACYAAPRGGHEAALRRVTG